MIFDGVVKILKGDAWESEFDLSPKGLPRSFIAVALYVPLCFIVAKAAVKYNAVEGHVPYPEIALILILIALTFPLIAYTLCSVFNKLENFRPWVITRNWSVLFVMAAMAAAFGLYVIGLLPFSVAFYIGMFFYLGTLAVDIRLAMRAGGFDWFGAVFAGVIISISSILVLLLGLTQVLV